MEGIVYPSNSFHNLVKLWYQYLFKTLEIFYILPICCPYQKKQHQYLCTIIELAYKKNNLLTLDLFALPEINAAIHCYYKIDNKQPMFTKVETTLSIAFTNIALKVSQIIDNVIFTTAPCLLSFPQQYVRLIPKNINNLWFFNCDSFTIDSKEFSLNILSNIQENEYFKVETSYYNLNNICKLSLFDSNPIVEYETHPEKKGNTLDLGNYSIDIWVSSLCKALQLLETYTPQWISELKLILQQIIPTGYHTERHFSASYQETVGTIYMSLHPDIFTMLVGIIHEFQHQKINMVSFIDPIMHNKFSSLHKSPLRPDPRPLWGILLAVHAFAPVSYVLQQIEKNIEDILSKKKLQNMLKDIAIKNNEAIEILEKYADWTPNGKLIWNEILMLIKQ